MMIRRAQNADIPQLAALLYQVHALHADARPDIFRKGARKYDDGQLRQLLADPSRPVFVAAEEQTVLGYIFCVLQHAPHPSMTDILTLYIDDLCVDASCRGSGIGTALYRFALDFARAEGCYNVTLNVWNGNDAALAFYQKCGMSPQKVCMEHILRPE